MLVQPMDWEYPPEEGNGNPLQYSCLKNRMDRVDWRAIVQRVTDIGHISATKHVPPGSSLSSIALK